MGKKGFFVTTSVAVVLAVVVVVLLVAEGLLIGFLAVPSCSDPAPTTTVPPKTTTVPPASQTTSQMTSVRPGTDQTTTTEPMTSAGPDVPWVNPRLPLDLKPISYDVTLRPVLEEVDGTYWFYGSSSVRYQCMNATNLVILHSITLNYPDLWSDYLAIKDLSDDSEQMIQDVMFYEDNEYMVVTMESDCVEGRNYEMSFSQFNGELGEDLAGLYRSEYVDEFGNNKILLLLDGDYLFVRAHSTMAGTCHGVIGKVIATTQMESFGARRTFPCFDEPSMKAVFAIKLLFRNELGHNAVSNMPPLSSQMVDVGGIQWNETTFEETAIMPSYLLAMVVSEFIFEPSFTTNGIQTHIYARPFPIRNGEGKYAAEVIPAMLEEIADYFNVSYPLPKSDQLAVPDFGFGAMENWGLNIYREERLLFNPSVSSVYDKYAATHTESHELAHQWFGNLVTCAWWSDIWLNEGFASFVEYIGVNAVHPDWKQDEMFIVYDTQLALAADAYSTSHPLHHPEGLFSTITYSKGASVLRMISGFLGNETFTSALTKYLIDFSYGNAGYNDLFRYLINEAELAGITDYYPAPLQEILETWVLQMGYPLMTMSKELNPNVFRVHQEYFLIDEDDTPAATPGSDTYNYEWYVPFTALDGSVLGTDASILSIWVRPGADHLYTRDPAEEFAIGNINAVGYYRVAYEEGMWQAIVNKLKTSNFTDISPQNRAQLIDDVFAVARSGRAGVTIESAFDITRYLEQELDYIPWRTLLDNMVTYERIFAGSNIFGDFSAYLEDLLNRSIYSFYGWEDTDTSDAVQIERMTRGLAIQGACQYGLPDCVNRAVELYQHWMENPDNNTISPTYRRYVYCTAIQEGGESEWDFAWQQFLEGDSAQEKTNLRYALSCTQESWLINRYIEYCLDSTLIRKQDVSATMGYIADHEYSKYVAWAFAVNNWDLLMNTVGSDPTSNMLSAARRRFSTEYDLGLIEILRPIAGPEWESTLNSYYNSVVDNVEWRIKVEDRIGAWLNGTPLPAENRPTKSKTSHTKYKNVNRAVIADDRGLLKKF